MFARSFTAAALCLAVVSAFGQSSLRVAKRESLLLEARPLPRVVLRVPAGRSAQLVGASLGIAPRTVYPGGWAVFDAPSVADAATIAARARRLGIDPLAFRDEILPVERHAFVPDDPIFPFLHVSGQPGQWHLVNTGNVSGQNVDARLLGAWNGDRTGSGAIIGIVDDSYQASHPDLAPNTRLDLSYDFGGNDPNPDPVATTDEHGIAVAGVAAARGGNGIGVTGAAPFASLAGLRCDFNGTGPASQFVSATSHRNDLIKVKNHSYGFTSPFINNASQINALRAGALEGVIHVVSAGNSRTTPNEDCNKSMMQNDWSTIAVAALGSNARFSSYSSFGSNVFVTAPSNSNTGFAITTTDRLGSFGYNGHPNQDYTNGFGGTSSAAPLVSGIMALLKEVRPDADMRLAKHLIARTSIKWDPANVEWTANGAGLTHANSYGFGGIDATALTARAALGETVTALTTTSIATTTVAAPIPDASATGVSRTFSVASTTPLEDLRLTVNITHPYRGDLEMFVTSPSGTTSKVMATASDSGDNIVWTFSSVAFWGENPQGTWTIRLADRFASDLGTWNSFSVLLRQGTLEAPVTDAGTVTAPGSASQTLPRFGSTSAPALVLTLNNTGTTTWRASQGYAIGVISGDPNDLDIDPLPDVAPGATVEVAVRLTERETGGRRDYGFALLKNGTAFGTPASSSIELLYDWDAVPTFETAFPGTVDRDGSVPVTVRLRNSGTLTWRADRMGRFPRVGLRFDPADAFSADLPRLPAGTTVPPAGSTLLRVKLRAPSIAGVRTPGFRAQIGRGPFGAILSAGPVTVQ